MHVIARTGNSKFNKGLHDRVWIIMRDRLHPCLIRNIKPNILTLAEDLIPTNKIFRAMCPVGITAAKHSYARN